MPYRYLSQLFLLLILFSLFIPCSVQAETENPSFTHSTADYQLPSVQVTRQDGKTMSFNQALNDGRPVIMNFIFTSCSAICPMLSHTLSKAQTKLKKVHFVSVSIDPENDTPEKLTEYAKKFNAGTHWDFYTSSLDNIVEIQKAFAAYQGDKMNHSSIIFMRASPKKPWSRLEGFASPDAVVQTYQNLAKTK